MYYIVNTIKVSQPITPSQPIQMHKYKKHKEIEGKEFDKCMQLDQDDPTVKTNINITRLKTTNNEQSLNSYKEYLSVISVGPTGRIPGQIQKF